VDARPDVVRWSKPPLELAVDSAAGAVFRMIGVHAKSKVPHGARSPAAVMRRAIQNRRKQLAQCIWLRARIDAHLAAGDPLIVLGDLNDGPGLDEYEALFGRSSLEIVMGEGEAVQMHDPAASPGPRRAGWGRRRPRPGSGCRTRGAGWRRWWITSWSRPT
jgi:hypothetical protein